MEQLRKGTGKPQTPTESIRLFRADMKRLWDKSSWQPLLTIWCSPVLEAEFVEHCRRAGLDPTETAPVVLNNLRWCWRRSVLNHNDDPGWQRVLSRRASARPGSARHPRVMFTRRLP